MQHTRRAVVAIAMFCSLTAFDCGTWRHGFHGHDHGHGHHDGGHAGTGGTDAGSPAPPTSGDVPGTLGDDRPGFVVCDGASDGIANATTGSLSCNGPCNEVASANSAPICAPPPASDSDDVQACDGPEDCGSGLTCCATEWTFCIATCNNFTRCHVDADCPAGAVCKPGRVPSAHGAGECAAP